MIKNDTQQSLLEKLEIDFRIGSPPIGADLIDAESRKRRVESDQVYKFFEGKRWQEIKLANLQNEYIGDPSASISFMNAQAVRYYLPAFLRVCLSEYERADMVYLATLWQLTPSLSNLTHDAFSALFDPLSSNQKTTVAKILLYLAEAHKDDYGQKNDAHCALDEYWKEFIESE